jgi:hypothetical protein
MDDRCDGSPSPSGGANAVQTSAAVVRQWCAKAPALKPVFALSAEGGGFEPRDGCCPSNGFQGLRGFGRIAQDHW